MFGYEHRSKNKNKKPWKTMANVRKDRYIKLVITEKKKNDLISYYKVFHRTLVGYRNKKNPKYK